jgi:hypothetical protein
MKTNSVGLVVGLLVCGLGLGANAATSPPDIVSPSDPGNAPVVESNQDNMILNGDFEFSSYPPSCYFNQDNDSATGLLSAITVWGEADEIDYMNDGTDCGYAGPPQSGKAKIAIHRQAETGYGDAFCFELDSPAVAEVAYLVSFYIWADTGFDPDIGAVEIGLSNEATSFGTLVASGMGNDTGWTYVELTFVAPVTGQYLCVQPEEIMVAWNHLDNFRLETAPVPVEKINWGSVRSLYR